MTAADQPTTEPGAPMMSGPGHASFCGNEAPHKMHRHPEPDSYEVCSGREAPLAPAPQPAAERFDGGWDEAQWEAWSNDVASEMPEEWDSDEGQEAIILRFVKYATAHLAACPSQVEPAADTETEVQWGIRTRDGGPEVAVMVDPPSPEQAERIRADGYEVVRSTLTTTRTPWEEA